MFGVSLMLLMSGSRKKGAGSVLPSVLAVTLIHTRTHTQKESEREFPKRTPHILMDKDPGDCGDLPSLWDQNLAEPLKEGLHGDSLLAFQ